MRNNEDNNKSMLTMGKPTRILKEPYRKKLPGYGYSVLHIECNDGLTYTIYQLAEIVGIRASGLWQRIRDNGWWWEYILADKAKPGKSIDGRTYNSLGNGARSGFSGLSNKPRNHNLLKIKVGSYEGRHF